jgi:hypothetical protein
MQGIKGLQCKVHGVWTNNLSKSTVKYGTIGTINSLYGTLVNTVP